MPSRLGRNSSCALADRSYRIALSRNWRRTLRDAELSPPPYGRDNEFCRSSGSDHDDSDLSYLHDSLFLFRSYHFSWFWIPLCVGMTSRESVSQVFGNRDPGTFYCRYFCDVIQRNLLSSEVLLIRVDLVFGNRDPRTFYCQFLDAEFGDLSGRN